MTPIDILVFAPHPDDAELCCGGLLLQARDAGRAVAIVDVTRGEMGTRGTAATRRREAAAASRLLGIRARENLGLPDGHLHDGQRLRAAMVRMLRRFRPSLVLAPHWEDQHPDHAAVGQSALYAAFLAGVPRFDPRSARGVASARELPYRPRQVLHYNNRYGIQAGLVVDISGVIERKLDLLRCYKTQFGADTRNRNAPRTRLSHERFFEWLRGLHRFYGHQGGVEYGEPYCVHGPLAVRDASVLL